MVKGINHITLSVKNLERSFAFYRDALKFKPLMKSAKSAYFLVGDMWFCIEEDPHARKVALPEYTHIAFSVDAADLPKLTIQLQAYGATSFKTNSSEGDSFYFTDPDGHKLELHVGSWKSRIESYKMRGDLQGYEFFE